MQNDSFPPANECFEHDGELGAETIAIIAMKILFCVIAVVCNAAVVIILYQKPKLRNKSNSHLTNLVLSDFLYCLTLPLTLTSALSGSWQFGVVACQLHGFFTVWVVLAIEFNFPIFAIYRIIVITRSQNRFSELYKSHTHWLHVLTWITAALCAFPPLVGWGRYGYCDGIPHCFLTFWYSQSYLIFLLLASTIVPCCVMVFCYTKVIMTVRQSSKRVRSATQNAVSGSSASLAACDDRRTIRPSSPTPLVLYSDRDFLPIPQRQPAKHLSTQRRPSAVSITGRNNRESMRRGSLASIASSTISNVRPSELRLGRSLALVTLSYICTWLPVIAFVLSSSSTSGLSRDVAVQLIQMFLFIHVSVNPLVYGLLTDPLKSVVLRICRCGRSSRAQDAERWVPPSVASVVPQVKMGVRNEKRADTNLPSKSHRQADDDVGTLQTHAPVSVLSATSTDSNIQPIDIKENLDNRTDVDQTQSIE